MRTVREKIRQQTARTRLRVDLGELVGPLNRIILAGGLLRHWELHEEAGRSRSIRLASAVAVPDEAAGSTRSAVPGGVTQWERRGGVAYFYPTGRRGVAALHVVG
jgi:hypothetical protein